MAAHSLGGLIAVDYALAYPEQVKKLILVDSAGIPPQSSVWTKIFKTLRAQVQFWRLKYKENFLIFFRILQRPRKNWRSLLIAYSHDISSKICLLKSPTLLIWGAEDHIYPIAQAKIMNEMIEQSSLCIIDGADHDWIIHSPKMFWDNL